MVYNMNIKVVGSGCPVCAKLYDMLVMLVKDKKLDAKIEYITDVQKLIDLGVMGSPALVVDEKVMFVGAPGNERDLLKIINSSK